MSSTLFWEWCEGSHSVSHLNVIVLEHLLHQLLDLHARQVRVIHRLCLAEQNRAGWVVVVLK